MSDNNRKYIPGITVVIPVRDRASVVGPTLDSVAAQTYRPMHVILVDNGSTDDTASVLSRWADSVRADDFEVEIVFQPVPGECAARNAGIRQVKTEWTMSFDSDDIMYPDHVARAVRTISVNPAADMVLWGMSDSHNGRERFFYPPERNFWFHAISDGAISPLRYAVKTDMFFRAGMWNESIMLHGDLDMAIKLLKLDPVIVTADNSITHKVCDQGGASMTRGRAADIIGRSLHAWRIIEAEIPPEASKWLEFTKIYIWALLGKCDLKAAGVEKSDLGSGSMLWRLWLRFAYWYTSRGGRGVCRLFMLLSDKSKLP